MKYNLLLVLLINFVLSGCISSVNQGDDVNSYTIGPNKIPVLDDRNIIQWKLSSDINFPDVNNANFLNSIPASGFIRSNGSTTTTVEIPFDKGIGVCAQFSFFCSNYGGPGNVPRINTDGTRLSVNGSAVSVTNAVSSDPIIFDETDPTIGLVVDADDGIVGFMKDSRLYFWGEFPISNNLYVDRFSAFLPATSETIDNGGSSNLWKSIYATNHYDKFGTFPKSTNIVTLNGSSQTLTGALTVNGSLSAAGQLYLQRIVPALNLNDTSAGQADITITLDNNLFKWRRNDVLVDDLFRMEIKDANRWVSFPYVDFDINKSFGARLGTGGYGYRTTNNCAGTTFLVRGDKRVNLGNCPYFASYGVQWSRQTTIGTAGDVNIVKSFTYFDINSSTDENSEIFYEIVNMQNR